MRVELRYERAAAHELDRLTQTRMEVLRAVHKLPKGADMGELEERSFQYYQKALRDGTHIAYLALDGDRFVGAGGVSFFQVMPTYHNPSGRKAYIMNLYTDPAYRRQGIAYRMLDILVQEAKAKGVRAISLDATEMGRPLYEKYGFVGMRDEMELPWD